MRSLVVTEFMSLDGVVDSPGGGKHPHAGWTFKDVEMDEAVYEVKARILGGGKRLFATEGADKRNLRLVEHATCSADAVGRVPGSGSALASGSCPSGRFSRSDGGST